MVENFRKKYTETSRKRSLLEKFQGLPKLIRYTTYGITTAAGIFFFTAGGTTWLATHYHNLQTYWQNRSENIEKKVAETGIAYIPLINNTDNLDSNPENVINPNGIEEITGRPLSEWDGKLGKNIGELAEIVFTEIKSDPTMQALNIDSIYVNPDSQSAYTAAIVRNNQGNLELALREYVGFNKLVDEKKQKEEAFKQMNTALAERQLTLTQKARLEEKLTEAKTQLTETKTVLQKTEEKVQVYANDEQRVAQDYFALAQKYGFNNISDEQFPGIEAKLKGDIKYGVSFNTIYVDGDERYEAVIRHEKKEMSLAEKTRNLASLDKYMNLLTRIENVNSSLNAWKVRPWIDGLVTTITPIKGGVEIIVETSSGKIIYKRSNLRYNLQNLKNELY